MAWLLRIVIVAGLSTGALCFFRFEISAGSSFFLALAAAQMAMLVGGLLDLCVEKRDS